MGASHPKHTHTHLHCRCQCPGPHPAFWYAFNLKLTWSFSPALCSVPVLLLCSHGVCWKLALLVPLHQIWLKLLGKGPSHTWSKRRNIIGMLMMPKKNIFTCTSGRNMQEAKQRVEEPGEVILVFTFSSSHVTSMGPWQPELVSGSYGCAAPSPASFTTKYGCSSDFSAASSKKTK